MCLEAGFDGRDVVERLLDLSTEGANQVAGVREFGACACDVGVLHSLGHVVAELLADLVELVLNKVGLGLCGNAVFEDVDINALPCSYTLHAFIYPTGAEATTPPLGPTIASIMDDPNYAGLGGVFAGKADVCTNCQNSDPFDVRIDVSARLKALGLSAADAVVKVVAVDEEEEYMAVERL